MGSARSGHNKDLMHVKSIPTFLASRSKVKTQLAMGQVDNIYLGLAIRKMVVQF